MNQRSALALCLILVCSTLAALSCAVDAAPVNVVQDDTTPPVVDAIWPLNGSTTTNVSLNVSVIYSDETGVNLTTDPGPGRMEMHLLRTDIEWNAYYPSDGVMVDGPDAEGFCWHPRDNWYDLDYGTYKLWLNISDTSPAENRGFFWYTFEVPAPDVTPPSLDSVSPTNGSTSTLPYQNITGTYSDDSGVDYANGTIEIDGVNQTANATLDADGFAYAPTSEWANGNHTINLNISDNASNPASFWFTFTSAVDHDAPSLDSTEPINESTISDVSTNVTAAWSDASDVAWTGLYAPALRLNGNALDANLTVTADGFSYDPPANLAYGIYYLNGSIFDNSSQHNGLDFFFWFILSAPPAEDTTAPTIASKHPHDNTSTTDRTPTISANYSDETGIDSTSVVLLCNDVDLTSVATIGSTGITYTPSTNWGIGIYIVTLYVEDNSSNENPSTVTWTFVIGSSLDGNGGDDDDGAGTTPPPETPPAADSYYGLSYTYWSYMIIGLGVVCLVVALAMGARGPAAVLCGLIILAGAGLYIWANYGALVP